MKIRCYLPPEKWDRSVIQINGREAHHLAHVLRVSPGFKVTCFDGQGTQAQAVVRSVSRKGVSLELGQRLPLEEAAPRPSGQRQPVPPPPWQVSLAVAIPKKGKLDQIVDQATQLGVHRLIPLLTGRGVVRIRLEEWPRKEPRLKQIVVEAGKQAGVDRLPILDSPIGWDDFVRSMEGYDRILMATVEGPHEDLGKLLSHGPVAKILLLIGPEGDWTSKEIEQAVGVGAHRISLGPTVLRCETAVVSGLSIVTALLRGRFRP